MRQEFDATPPPVPITILGVNEIGAEDSNPTATDATDIPWLQDVVDVNAWQAWNANLEDIFVLDGGNVEVNRYNITTNKLNVTANYDELKAILLAAAEDEVR